MLQVFALSLIQLLWINRWPGADASYFRCLGEELCSSQGLESKGLRSLFHLLCDVSFRLTRRIKVAREPSHRCKKKSTMMSPFGNASLNPEIYDSYSEVQA